jgi:hypothetical protein
MAPEYSRQVEHHAKPMQRTYGLNPLTSASSPIYSLPGRGAAAFVDLAQEREAQAQCWSDSTSGPIREHPIL